MKSLLLVPVLLFAMACGKKSSSGGSKVSQIFVQGNPLTMIDGTEKDTKSFITPENYTEFTEYALSGMYLYVEKSLVSKKKLKDIREGQEATETDLTTKTPRIFSISSVSSGNFVFEDDKNEIRFRLSEVDGQLQVKTMEFGDEVHKVQVEHYSISPDKSKMSFLLKLANKADGQAIISASFYKYSPKVSVPKVSSEYHYLYGKGVVVPWKLDQSRKITVTVCPSMESHMSSSQVKSAIEAWERPFWWRTNELEIDVKMAKTCKPFSDVNEHSLHFVDKYLTLVDKKTANYGFTMIHSDLSQGFIYDADIILLASEIKKHERYYDYFEQNRTVTHEMGHFLGLDHQFDKDENGKNIVTANQSPISAKILFI